MLSRIAYFVSVVLMCYASFFFYPRWQKGGSEATIAWDVSGYYWYLPSIFIYKDLKHQSFKDSILHKYGPTNTDFQQAMKLDNGNYVMKYASGMAVMYLPFFAVAHMVARPLGYPADGFSAPYQFAIQLGGFLVSILGLWYLRKLLLYYYTDMVVAVALLILVTGTNYINYAAIDNGMSHCWLFTVYVFLLLNTRYFYETFKVTYAVRIGLLVGLAALARPTDALSCIIPLLWGMESISLPSIRQRILLLLSEIRPFSVAVICAVLVVSIQLVYWKYVSGHWLVYSYNDQKLRFRSPYILDYTFSFKSGWLIYTPMMILAFIGIIPFVKYGKNKVAILAFFLLNYYVICCWDIWWYGGRAMIQSYPVLFFPIASLINLALNRKVWLWILLPVVLLFVYFNTWITWQYHKGDLYDTDNMTQSYFLRVAGRWSAPKRTLELRDKTELFEGRPKDLQLVYENGFERDTGKFFTTEAISGGKSLILDKERQVSPNFNFAWMPGNARWLRVQATFRCKHMEWDIWKETQFIVRLLDKNKQGQDAIVKENMIRVYRFLEGGDTKDIALDVKLPQQRFDSVNVWFANSESDKEITIDNLKAWRFSE
jgi:hypothetical protein